MQLPLKLRLRTIIVIPFFVGGVAAWGQGQRPKFWDKEKRAEVGAFAGAITCDSWATQALSKRPHFIEYDPLARPFVRHGDGREALGAGIGLTLGVGPSYLLHRAGHERASKWWLRLATFGESTNAMRQVYLTH